MGKVLMYCVEFAKISVHGNRSGVNLSSMALLSGYFIWRIETSDYACLCFYGYGNIYLAKFTSFLAK